MRVCIYNINFCVKSRYAGLYGQFIFIVTVAQIVPQLFKQIMSPTIAISQQLRIIFDQLFRIQETTDHLSVQIILSQPIAMEQGRPIQISEKITCATIPSMGKISRARSAQRALISLIACLLVIAFAGL
jgi:hypothetical protein